jgi:HlyD family secretion protein
MKGKIVLLVIIVAIALGGYAFSLQTGKKEPEIEFRYATVERGEIVRSISATGQVVALTQVDVKSLAGGRVVQLAVDEGSEVKKGDLIAIIDPEDTQAIFDQANADVQSAEARASQAQQSLALQAAQAENDIRDAETSLEAAKARLRRAQIESRRQPSLSNAAIANARASYDSAVAAMERLQKVTVPQMRREAQANLTQARIQRDAANANLKRQEELAQKGFVSGTVVDTARSNAAGAQGSFTIAQQTADTVEADIQTTLAAQRQTVAQAKAALDQAQTNLTQVEVQKAAVIEAQKAVQAAEVALKRARDNRLQIDVRRSEVLAAQAATVRSRVSLDNAKVQLDSTTVVAPRDGVVTLKYLEEGTIIPPGTSTFAEGTSLVQLSDVNQLFVECAVDEADIGQVRKGQRVRITTEAYPKDQFDGVVDRVNPSATTAENITAVKVRVKVLPGAKVKVLPGMNATCEFLTLEKDGILVVPSQAINNEDGKSTVRVKGPNPKKPVVREVKIGETGNEGVEIVEGLSQGDEVVIAEINLEELRELQKKMQETEEGGGLAGGGGRRRR